MSSTCQTVKDRPVRGLFYILASVPRRASVTDRLLADMLAERGVKVDPRRIERWRQAGFFSYERRYLGRGRGSTSSFNAGVVDLVAELAGVLAVRRSLRDAVLVLHARGQPLDPSVVRRALAAYLERVEVELRQILAKKEAGIAASDLLRTSKRGRQLQRHLSESGLEDDAFYDIVSGLLGDAKGWVPAFVSATGFAAIAAQLLDTDMRGELAGFLERLSLPALRAAVVDATDDEIRQAGADSRVLLPYVAAFVELLARLAGRRDALPLVGDGPLGVDLAIGEWSAISIWARRCGVELGRGKEQATEFGPALTAMLQLLRMFSFSRGPLFGSDYEEKLARLKPYERDSVIRRIRDFAADNPSLIEAITSASSSGPVRSAAPDDRSRIATSVEDRKGSSHRDRA